MKYEFILINNSYNIIFLVFNLLSISSSTNNLSAYHHILMLRPLQNQLYIQE